MLKDISLLYCCHPILDCLLCSNIFLLSFYWSGHYYRDLTVCYYLNSMRSGKVILTVNFQIYWGTIIQLICLLINYIGHVNSSQNVCDDNILADIWLHNSQIQCYQHVPFLSVVITKECFPLFPEATSLNLLKWVLVVSFSRYFALRLI